MAGEVVVINAGETSASVEALETDIEKVADEVEQIEEQVTDAVIAAEVAEEKSEDALQWLARLSEQMGQISTTLTDKLEGLNNRLAKLEAQTEAEELTPQVSSEMLEVEAMPMDTPETVAETFSETKTEAQDESAEENPVAEAVEQLQSVPRQIIKL
jgi:transposase